MTQTDGITAADLLKNHPQRALDWRTVAEMTRQMVAALEAIHGAGKTHGAICPENLLIRDDGKIGLREATKPDLEFPAALIHCSPQQGTGQATTPADDVYSLGSTLYELLTGEPPFSAQTKPALLEQIQKETPLTIPLMLEAMGRENAVPGIFKMVVDRCLQKDPADRPDLIEIKRLLPKEAAPSKRAESSATPLGLSPIGGSGVDAPPANPTPRINPFPFLLATITVLWIGFGTELTGLQKSGAIFLVFTAAIGLSLAKRRKRY